MPNVEDTPRGRVICQHCRIEAPLTAEMAVRLKAVIEDWALPVLLSLLRWLKAATNSGDDRITSNETRSMIG